MYQPQVFHPGKNASSITVTTLSASEVMQLIPRLLAEHAGCERVEVSLGGGFLFAVDCHGQTINR